MKGKKQSGVPRKRCSENMQQIYRRTPSPKCDFNKVAMQLYWNRTSAWAFSCKFAAYFQNTFSKEHIWTAASKGRIFKALCITTCAVCQCTFIYHVSILTNFFFSCNILSIFFLFSIFNYLQLYSQLFIRSLFKALLDFFFYNIFLKAVWHGYIFPKYYIQ